jgi:Zn-dependent protease with chaperone function
MAAPDDAELATAEVVDDDAPAATPVEKPKAKGEKPKPKGERAEPKPARKSKLKDGRKVPYPLSPAEVPEGLTDYADSYTKQQNLLLAGLFVFLVFYIGAVLFFGMLAFWSVWSFNHIPALKIVLLVFSGIFFLFLVKGFFKSHAMDKEMHIEITEDEHPVLFEFIYQLCDELGAPLPNKVYVSPDVNAAVMMRTSLINLFVEPKKDLLIGLGLVNSVNLSEFKAVLAHEFGHFSQSAMASSYTYIANRIIADLVEGEDWFDRMVNWCKRQENLFSIIGYGVGGILWTGRKIVEWCYKAITLQRLAVSREREFHADLVAASAAGSNAVVHCLLRTEFGHQCFVQAVNDLVTAMDHKLYSNDLYMHQDRAAAIVRRKKKEAELGMPPVLATDRDGQKVEVFDAEEEELEDEIPPMWRTHPSNSDREKNAKERFVPAVVDHRSPWLLFDDAPDLRERMTYKFYRMVFKIPKNADLADALKVQKFIDNEYAETTFDAKYKGCYDDRPIEPGELQELNGILRDSPWNDDRMEKVFDKLYDGCETHAEAHGDLHKEEIALRNSIVGRPSPKVKRKLEELKEKQDENWEWFKSFDRRVYLLHVQMASAADPEAKDELVERYRFQLEVQRLYQESRAAFNKADSYLGAFFAAQRGEIQLPPDFNGELIQVFREQWKVLKTIIKAAKDISMPALKNFEEGENLAGFILEGKMVPEPPLSHVKFAWIYKLMDQLQGVKNRCVRLHFKSLGGILKLQEQIATKWKAGREPVAAEVLDDAPVAAEVIAAEVVPAEVIPAEVIAAEVVEAAVIEADVIAADVIEAEVLPEVPLAPPEVPKAVAAFAPTPAATVAYPPPAPPAPKADIEATGTFSLDSGLPLPVPAAKPVPASAPVAPPSVSAAPAALAGAGLFSLDADDYQPAAPVAEPPKPAPPKSTPALSGITEVPAVRALPAAGKRPRLKITMVKPGEKSPLAK